MLLASLKYLYRIINHYFEKSVGQDVIIYPNTRVNATLKGLVRKTVSIIVIKCSPQARQEAGGANST